MRPLDKGYIAAKFCWSRTPISKMLSVQCSLFSCNRFGDYTTGEQNADGTPHFCPAFYLLSHPQPAAQHFTHSPKIIVLHRARVVSVSVFWVSIGIRYFNQYFSILMSVSVSVF